MFLIPSMLRILKGYKIIKDLGLISYWLKEETSDCKMRSVDVQQLIKEGCCGITKW